MNQSETNDYLLETGGRTPEFHLRDRGKKGGSTPDDDGGAAAAGPQRGVDGPAVEEIVESSSSEDPEEELPDPEEERKRRFVRPDRLMEVDDRSDEVKAQQQRHWQKQRKASILSALTMGCLRSAKPPMDSNNEEELEPDRPCCRFNMEGLT
ncbi:hypothetical protein NHX12_025364 [Muraenolepis orangiensis]|uniref:Uncharacterized protein n=1 Tax=Muraenolepis orangiensis TaxID=630683 RepID=A0A9Q0EMP1_9TELE|nr:hypothetical protein NHX12_025364 [Muraenolepis orangiensis]